MEETLPGGGSLPGGVPAWGRPHLRGSCLEETLPRDTPPGGMLLGEIPSEGDPARRGSAWGRPSLGETFPGGIPTWGDPPGVPSLGETPPGTLAVWSWLWSRTAISRSIIGAKWVSPAVYVE